MLSRVCARLHNWMPLGAKEHTSVSALYTTSPPSSLCVRHSPRVLEQQTPHTVRMGPHCLLHDLLWKGIPQRRRVLHDDHGTHGHCSSHDQDAKPKEGAVVAQCTTTAHRTDKNQPSQRCIAHAVAVPGPQAGCRCRLLLYSSCLTVSCNTFQAGCSLFLLHIVPSKSRLLPASACLCARSPGQHCLHLGNISLPPWPASGSSIHMCIPVPPTWISVTTIVVSCPTPGGRTLPKRLLCLRLLRT